MEHLEIPLPAALASRAVKLPPLWPAGPRAWLASVEGAFRLHNIADEQSQFYTCLQALLEATVSLINELMEANPLPAKPYTNLRLHLLAPHQLTDIQRVEQLQEDTTSVWQCLLGPHGSGNEQSGT